MNGQNPPLPEDLKFIQESSKTVTSKMFDVQQMSPNDFDDDIQAKDMSVRQNRKRQAQRIEDEPMQAQIPGGVYERPKGIERDPTTECGSLGDINPSGTGSRRTEPKFKEMTHSSRNMIPQDLTPQPSNVESMVMNRQKPPKRKNHFKSRKGKSVKPALGMALNPENFEKALQSGFDKAQKFHSRKNSHANPMPMKGRKFAPIGHQSPTSGQKTKMNTERQSYM